MSGQDTLGFSGQTGCFSKAGLAEGTNANTIKIVAPNGAGVDFCIDGVAYHKADTDNIAMTALANQAASTTCLYLVTLNSSGTLAITKGNEVLTADLGVVGGSCQWPAVPADVCPIGGFKLALDSTAGGFTSGTTDLGAANVTDTYYDFLGGLPLAPQVS
jgi:hypothetical protein